MADADSGAARQEFRCIATAEQIGEAVRSLAAEIARDHPCGEPLVLVAVLKGGVMFAADLMRHLPIPLELEFVKARSYRGLEQQRVEILDRVDEFGLEGRHVLLLDCVLDSGRTLTALKERIEKCRPASLKTCVLLSKQRPRQAALEPDYVGLEIPDVFVVGYGLDYDNRWRHLPHIADYGAAGPHGTGGE